MTYGLENFLFSENFLIFIA